MSYTDKTLICRDCGQNFVFTAGEQEFHAQKGFTNPRVDAPSAAHSAKRRVVSAAADDAAVVRAKCSARPAPHAENPARCLSSPPARNPSIAPIASRGSAAAVPAGNLFITSSS